MLIEMMGMNFVQIRVNSDVIKWTHHTQTKNSNGYIITLSHIEFAFLSFDKFTDTSMFSVE